MLTILLIFTLLSSLQYDMLVDVHANRPRQAPEFVTKSFFGQLQHILVVHLPEIQSFGLAEPTTLFLAGIRSCHLEAQNALGMPYYTKMAHFEVVDMSCVQCLVARVADSVAQKRWALVDRSGNTPRSYYVENS